MNADWFGGGEIAGTEERKRILSTAPLLQKLIDYSGNRRGIQMLIDSLKNGQCISFDSDAFVAKNRYQVNPLEQLFRHRSLSVSEQQRPEKESSGTTIQRTQKDGSLGR
ncbi:MAG: hypothetical protein OXE79_06210 [Acidimicrobiaceae bacterium]|nr:hypothetical protein [Acidimicrobiaceae bacterium]MCY4280341.1 hypothetical protein [Acidimicrobiaceae bacterium]